MVVLHLLQAATKRTLLPSSIMVLALDNAMLALTWRLAAMEQQPSPSRAAAVALGRAVEDFAARLDHIGTIVAPFCPAGACEIVADAVMRAQADLFLLFSEQKLKVGAALSCRRKRE